MIHDPLDTVIPGMCKRYLDISSQPLDGVLLLLDQNSDAFDTVILTNGDVCRLTDDDALTIFNHRKMAGKKVFISTCGYENKKFSNDHYIISYPTHYWMRARSPIELCVMTNDLSYGFSCLNNNILVHRLLLGYHLHLNNLLNKHIIFTQNTCFNWPWDNDREDVFLTSLDLDISIYNQYKNLLPIIHQTEIYLKSPNFRANAYNIKHIGFQSAYCNIGIESECEEFPYYRNINLPVITEKSYKPFASGQVPLWLAARGHLRYLTSLGFEVMADLLPPGYDDMQTPEQIKCILELVKQGTEFIRDFYFSHLREIQHNYELVNSDRVEKLILQRISDTINQ
jgi:hypothetical protein